MNDILEQDAFHIPNEHMLMIIIACAIGLKPLKQPLSVCYNLSVNILGHKSYASVSFNYEFVVKQGNLYGLRQAYDRHFRTRCLLHPEKAYADDNYNVCYLLKTP